MITKTIGACVVVLALISGVEGMVSMGVVVVPRLLPGDPLGLPSAYAVYLAQPRYQTSDGRAYWAEFRQSTQTEYVDGLMWRRKDMRGRFINVTEGERAGRAGVAESRSGLFGGSAVWGTGVDDADTLPANLSAHNYGEGGYVSTQDFLRFAEVLRTQAPLGTAIFYQGLNDVQAGCIDPGIPGASLKYRTLSADFERNPWALLRLQELAVRFLARFAAPYPRIGANRVMPSTSRTP